MQQKRGKRLSEEGLPGGKTVKVDDMRERGHTSSVQQERSFADVVSQGKARKARVFMGDSIIRKVENIVNRGDDITVCLPSRGYSREGRTSHGWWHTRCCSCACGNEQCREGGNVSHHW